MEESLEQKVWWDYLEEDLQELLRTSIHLNSKAKELGEGVHDFSFIVFPAAKAYEGFLKKLFLDMGFISKEEYSGKSFRVGKALNPSLNRERYKDESVYDKIVDFTGNTKLADTLWETWKNSRNLVFHWFPDEKQALSSEEAKIRLQMILDAIDEAYKQKLAASR